MMRRGLIVGNWKMNGLIESAQELAREIRIGWNEREKERVVTADLVLCPSFTALHAVHQVLSGTSIKLGAQNIASNESGAFTGEISGIQLRNVGCRFVIVGHSERRRDFSENNQLVAQKTIQALRTGLQPIICVGETQEERNRGETKQVVAAQLEAIFPCCPEASQKKQSLIIAYEPVWAIGTGQNATPLEAQEVSAFCREVLGKKMEANQAKAIRILYGGSLNPQNASKILAQPDIDGGLVGGASLKAHEFLAIVDALPKQNT